MELVAVRSPDDADDVVFPLYALEPMDPRYDARLFERDDSGCNRRPRAAGGLGDPLIARVAKAGARVVEGLQKLVEHVQHLGRDTAAVGLPVPLVARETAGEVLNPDLPLAVEGYGPAGSD